MPTLPTEKPHYTTWDEVFSHPTALEIKTLKAGTLKSRLSTALNLSNPGACGMADAPVTLPALAHLVRHPAFGSFLIDTGLDSSFARPGGSFKGLLKKAYFRNRYFVEPGEGIDEQRDALGENIIGLFLTHAHEHVAGVLALPGGISRACGAGERDYNLFPLIYSDFFRQRRFQTLDFSRACGMPVFDRALDVYCDGSFWALPTPGHTAGHVSYLANATSGPVLFTGDACICASGLELGVEPGKMEDAKQGRKSFLKIKEFAGKYTQVKIVFGHESDEFKIKYYVGD